MAIRMIGLDIDGTLLTPDGRITERTRTTLLKAASQGVHIVPVTGRPLSGIPSALNADMGIDYIISSNGASVWHEGRLVMQHRIAPKSCIELLNMISGTYFLAEVFIDGVGYVSEAGYNNAVRYFGRSSSLDYFVKSRRAVEDMDAFLERAQSVEEIAVMCRSEAASERIMQAVDSFSDLKYARPIPNYIEIVAKKGGKGTALTALAKSLGIESGEVMAVGDSDNDSDMLMKVGMPVAMGNAAEKLKQAAAFITADNSNDGVAYAVEKLVLN